MTTPPSGYQPSQDPYQQPGFGAAPPPAQPAQDAYQQPPQNPYQPQPPGAFPPPPSTADPYSAPPQNPYQPQPPGAFPPPDPYSAPPQPGHVYAAPYQPATQEQGAYQPQGPYEQPAPYAAPYGQPVAPQPGTNGFAIAALAVSFFSLCGAVLATIFGIVALRQIKQSGQRGKGLAIAGLCISALWFVLVAAAVAISILSEPTRDRTGTITTDGNVSVTALKTGDCIKSLKESSAVFSVPVTPCTQTHEGEVVGEFTLSGLSYPGEDVIDQQASDRCDTIMTQYTSETTLEEIEDLYYIYPRSSDWSKGSRTVTCIAVTAPRSTSVKG